MFRAMARDNSNEELQSIAIIKDNPNDKFQTSQKEIMQNWSLII